MEGLKTYWLVLACGMAASGWAQGQGRAPRFEDFPVAQVFKGKPAQPILTTAEERRYRTVIRQGVAKAWGVEDGITGKEYAAPGPNFAGHYVIVTWGCGSSCLMAAVVDLRTGRVLPPQYHHRQGHSYFLLIAYICEADGRVPEEVHGDYSGLRCGADYFVASESELKLIRRVRDGDE